MRALPVLVLGLSLVACKPASSVKEGGEESVLTEEANPKPTPSRAVCNPALASLTTLETLRVSTPVDGRLVAQQLRGRTATHNPLGWLATIDENLGRVSEGKARDVAFIEEQLKRIENEPASALPSLTAIVTQLRAVSLLEMRRLLAQVASGQLEGSAAAQAWTQASCLWTEALRPLAQRADALEIRGGEGWTASINQAFSAGASGLAGEPVAVKVAKQQIEKGMYAVAYRLILADAEQREAVAASEALGLVDALEDRLADRNGPGLKRIRRQLVGPVEAIDAAAIERELAIAFSKRARKYCDKAVVNAELGRPDAIAETWEGIVYTRVILPSMRDALAAEGFDADAYLEDWDAYLEAVKTSEGGAAGEISQRLVEWNCAYQDRLGIAECTATANEVNTGAGNE